MPQNRKFESGAARQRAYRERTSRMKRNGIALRLDEKTTVNIARPPVRYHGGKWRIASWILQYFPPHVTYCEPYAGGASILFQKEPSEIEIINDLNGDVVNFFDVLRSRPAELIRAIELTPYAREEHRRSYNREGDALERARRFYIRSRQSFGSGEGKYNTGWRYQVNNRRGTSTIEEWSKTDHLWEAARRLKFVQIDCDDALKVLQRFDTPNTLFYVDPPYVFDTRYSTEGYAHEMTNEQHIELAKLLHHVQGMVILSGYMSELYMQLYPEWTVVSKETKTNGNNPAAEYLWLSPKAVDVNRLPLFEVKS